MRHSRILTLAAVLLAAASTATAGNTAAYGQQTAPSTRAAVDSHFGPGVDVAPGETGIATVHCPQGEVPTGGGGQTDNPHALVSSLTSTGSDWDAGVVNLTNSTVHETAQVICTTP
jgi:hypothetical protein